MNEWSLGHSVIFLKIIHLSVYHSVATMWIPHQGTSPLDSLWCQILYNTLKFANIFLSFVAVI